MIKIGCIADDFTGASDAASYLQKGGLKTVYLNGDHLTDTPPLDADTQALVIALKCRSIPAEEAIQQVCQAGRWLRSHGTEHIYYKYCSTFDSTESGNIGPVVDWLMDDLQCSYTVLCPALPANGRTVKDGILYVYGKPLAESSMRYHPITPMRKSYLPDLMEMQSRYPCYCATTSLLKGPVSELREKIAAYQTHGHFTLAVDYQTDADGEAIAARFGSLPLLTGGSGLLEHLGRYYCPPQAVEAVPVAQRYSNQRGRLILAGSCSATTQRQVARYLGAGLGAVKIDPIALMQNRQSISNFKRQLQYAEGDILFYSTDTPEQVKSNQTHGAERISALLETTMGELAKEAVACGYDRIIVAGGETSGRVMKMLHYNAFEIHESIAPGVSRMVPVQNRNLNLVLKSGNFGGDDFFISAMSVCNG